ncbi:hypothetical protein R6Q57_001944 [Mikania cordata]
MDIAPAIDFNFNTSLYDGSYYTSAPSSPTQLTEMYCGFDELLIAGGAGAGADFKGSLATVPFAWEEKPGVPKTPDNLFEEHEFSFDVRSDIGSDSVHAEDLFQGGIIKAMNDLQEGNYKIDRERGRERGFSTSRLHARSRRTRSLSPLGVSDYRREQQPTITSTKPLLCPSENVPKRWSFMDLFLFRSASDGRAMDKDPLKKLLTCCQEKRSRFQQLK